MHSVEVLLEWHSLLFAARLWMYGRSFVIDTRAKLEPMPGALMRFSRKGGGAATSARVRRVEQLSDSRTRLHLDPLCNRPRVRRI